ncbi:unnamed protein product, partial [Polarella glacialis]
NTQMGTAAIRLPLLFLIASAVDDEVSRQLRQAVSCPGGVGGLDCLGLRVENSWTSQLTADPEQQRFAPNKRAREVTSGHYVLVRPSPLPDPYLAAYSPEVAALLELDEAACLGERFARLFSGDVDAVPGFNGSWATPYALSIYGNEQVAGGAGEQGNGYGDGRAISLAEVRVGDGGRWELQLKGSGTTPFCRGADGRAVLRSSVREFLASEAMHHLGVPTTRALSLVASGSEHVTRPWYSKDADEEGSSNRVNSRGRARSKHGGDISQQERCAMTTRVAPSFIRVGHFDLFGRRARNGDEVGRQQLEQLARHAMFRDYPHLVALDPAVPLQRQLLQMVAEVGERFAHLAAEWLRVGYVQSNFNADNCLVSGLTMDYGPFGFVEKYDPKWGMWIHAGEHFSFMNQPTAAGENFKTFALSLTPLLDQSGREELATIVQSYSALSQRALDKMWARKLGVSANSSSAAGELWSELEPLLRRQATDWTIFWRQLAEIPEKVASGDWQLLRAEEIKGQDADEVEDRLGSLCLGLLDAAFHEEPPAPVRKDWRLWLRRWLRVLSDEGSAEAVSQSMKRASPKYIPRESILVEAYEAAQKGDHSPLAELQELFRHPFEEQAFFGERFYQRQGRGAASQGGLGFMS